MKKNAPKSIGSGRPDVLFQRALEEHRVGRIDAAIKGYELVLKLRPRYVDALHFLGVAIHQRGEHIRAIELIERALKLQPDSAHMMCNLAEVLRSSGDPAAAEASSRRAIELNPNYPEAHVNLGSALFQQRRFADAERSARTALRLSPDLTAAKAILADALREQRRIVEAESTYRDLLASEPNHAAALSNLGLMLIENGRMEEGLDFCRRGATQGGAHPLTMQNFARGLLEFGRVDDALEVLERALHLDPNSAAVSMLIGVAWSDMGEIAEARNWLERALQLDSELREARVRVAMLEAESDNHQLAVEMLDTVLAAEPTRVDALLAKARSRLALGDVDGAVADHRAAIMLHPKSAVLHAALGRTLSTAGDIAGAVASQREALALNPRCAPAFAGLLTTLRHKTTEEERQAATALLDAPWMTDDLRSGLRFGLAAYHDGRGEWEEAASQMGQANQLRKTADARRHLAYEPAQYDTFVDRLIATFNPDLFERLSGLGSASERPVFIVGMPRSGTTLTEQILASHPEVHGAGERPFARQGMSLLPQLLGLANDDVLDCLARSDQAALEVAAQWHLARLAALDDGRAVRIVDKMPDNYAFLGWLAVLFPRARFIYCRRDFRDIALSCWITNFAEIRWANDLEHIARRIGQHIRLMDHWRRVLPARILEVDYESLVADQEGESRRLVDWLGLEWNERCLQFFKTERLVRTASVTQVREPIYRRSLARWQHYKKILEPVFLELHGYANFGEKLGG